MTSSNVTPMQFPSDQPGNDPLAYAVELWSVDRTALEQVLARAASASLARAIFGAAQQEYPGRYIVLRHGSTIVEAT